MKVKICGLTRECDIDFVNEALPDYVGFVFAKSRRQITPEWASCLRKRLNSSIGVVGVFVNAEVDFVNEIIQAGIIDIAQLHGSESEDYISKIAAPTIKSVCVGDKIPENSDYLLFDNACAGSGETFDWSLIPETKKPFFLAGGLNIENIDSAIKEVKPFGVDISSGVEVDGFKDRDKIIEIIRRVRNV